MKQETHKFIRFIVVGGLNTAVNYGVYALLIYAGLWHVTAATLSFVFGVTFNYQTHGRYVFGNRSGHAFRRYVLSWTSLYFANIAALDLLVRYGVNSYLAGAILVPPMAVLAFVVLKFVVFRADASDEKVP